MTEQDAMNFIDELYFKYNGSINENESYINDVVTILNKVTNSNSYEIGLIKHGLAILKDKITIYEWVSNNVISLYEFLNREILLFKLNLLEQ